MTNIITFSSPYKGFLPEPVPAKHCVPEPYKKLPNFDNNQIDQPTVKKCVPFLDVYSTGYMLLTPVEYMFTYGQNEKGENTGEKIIVPAMNIPPEAREKFFVNTHKNYQITPDMRNKNRTVDNVYKWPNHWHIKTPPGYSCLFIQPMNRNLPFEIISGIVDTDVYPLSVLFPFYWTGDTDKDYIIPEKTPMVQVIPFKRESWKKEIGERNEDIRTWLSYFSKFIDNYKHKIWHKKDYS
jgi:hypothetical protein